MKRFKITTVCDCWTEYIVEAETLEEAKNDYAEKHISAEDVDFRNEDIIDSECEELADEYEPPVPRDGEDAKEAGL